LVVNKVESDSRSLDVHEFMKLGLGEPLEISAHHGYGVGELLDRIVELMPETAADEPAEGLAISFVGRPNVGKSSLVNRILGQDKMIVHEDPGTTRDAIDTVVEMDGQRFTLIDTAGLRRKSKIDRGVELYSTMRTIKCIERCDVGVIVVDASDGVYQQDMRIASRVFESGAGVLIVFNKWDLVIRESFDFKLFEKFRQERFHFVKHAPVLRVSALTGSGTSNILPAATELAAKLKEHIPTSVLNRVLEDSVRNHAPPSFQGKEVRLYYATQLSRKWPSFVIFSNRPAHIGETYKRYLMNRFREAFGFDGIKLSLVFRKK
jgi:GTP-binding protein